MPPIKFNLRCIQVCIALSDSKKPIFNTVIRKMIEKSLFTERQIEIILKQRNLLEAEFFITRGAYYRQVGQTKEKLVALFYTIVLLRGLGVLLPDDIGVISDLSEKVSVISDSDVPPENIDDVINVIEKYIRQACNV